MLGTCFAAAAFTHMCIVPGSIDADDGLSCPSTHEQLTVHQLLQLAACWLQASGFLLTVSSLTASPAGTHILMAIMEMMGWLSRVVEPASHMDLSLQQVSDVWSDKTYS